MLGDIWDLYDGCCQSHDAICFAGSESREDEPCWKRVPVLLVHSSATRHVQFAPYAHDSVTMISCYKAALELPAATNFGTSLDHRIIVEECMHTYLDNLRMNNSSIMKATAKLIRI